MHFITYNILMHLNQNKQAYNSLTLQQKSSMNKRNRLPINEQQRKALIQRLEEQVQKLSPQATQNTQNEQRVKILKERIRLITGIREYNDTRLKNLEKILKHYSTHVFKPGQKYNFDEISYINEHMIMERFFAFVIDFKLNEIMVNGEKKQIVDSKEIVLLFKKCSSNSKNLDLPQFISCLERLFVMIFDENQGFEKKQKSLILSKRVKRLSVKKHEYQAKQKLNAKLVAQLMLKQGSNKTSPDAKKKQKPKVNKAKLSKIDAEIANIAKELNEITKQTDINPQSESLYSITDEQKIQSYMLRIGIDDRKQIQKKLRFFQKANYRYTETEELQKFKPPTYSKRQQKTLSEIDLKKQLVSMHHEWNKQKAEIQQNNANRFNNVRQKISQRQLQKSKMHLSKSLSKQQYEQKSIKMSERLSIRQKSLLDPYSLNRLVKRKEESDDNFYSLQMLHRSSPNELRMNKIMPDKYINYDPTDSIFLDQYGFAQSSNKKSLVSSNAQMIESTKRQAIELQTQQSKRLSRLAKNLHQNQHYLQKFLQRKW